MKKKLFCIVLSLAMVVTFMPAMALTAFGATTSNEVNTLDAFNTALAKGGTVKLVQQDAGVNTITINEATAIKKTATVNLNGQVLNVNGKTITVEKGKTLTFVDGSLKNKGELKNAFFKVEAGATLTFESGSFNGVGIENYGTLNIKGGKFVVCIGNGDKVNVSGGTLKNSGDESVFLNGGELNISGGTFEETAEKPLIKNYEYEKAIVNISGGTFSKCVGPVVLNDNKLNVTGGTFTENNDVVFQNNGAFVEIKGGAFTGNKAGVVLSEKADNQNNSAVVRVLGGSMTGNQPNAINALNGTELTFGGDVNVSGNYYQDPEDEKAPKVKTNVVLGENAGNVIKTEKLGAKANVGLSIGTSAEERANYFDASAVLTPFVSDLNNVKFADGKAYDEQLQAALDDANKAIDILEACYKILHVEKNYQEYTDEDEITHPSVAQAARKTLEDLSKAPGATVADVNKALDKAAVTMFGNKMEAIKGIVDAVAEDSLKLTEAAIIFSWGVTAKTAKAAVKLAEDISDNMREAVETAAGAAYNFATETADKINENITLAIKAAGQAAIKTADAIGQLGNAAGGVLEEALKDTYNTILGVLQAGSYAVDKVGTGIVAALNTTAKVAEAAATAAAISAIVGGVVNYAGQAFGALQARNVYNNAVKSISGLVGQASQNTAALLQKGAQAGGLVLANGVQVGGQLLQLLAAGQISAAVAGTIANTVAYIGSFAKYPAHHF